jgi:C-terminal processing protease CtpA/Prc
MFLSRFYQHKIYCLSIASLLAILPAGCGAPASRDVSHLLPAPTQRLSVADEARFLKFLKETVHSGAAPVSNCDFECQRMRTEFRYVVYVGEQIYAYWDQKKAETQIDYSAFARSLEERITNLTTPSEYYLILREWAAAFRDGHVNVLMKDDRSDLERYTADLRLETFAPAAENESLIVVNSTLPKLEVGDEVVEINGLNAAEALTQQEGTVSGSTRRMRRSGAANRLIDVIGIESATKPLRITVKRSTTAERVSVDVPRKAILAAPVDDKSTDLSEPEKSGIDLIQASIVPGNIGYLRIDGFSGSKSFELLQQAMDRLSRCSGLILDLRKNGGGDQSGNVILAQIAGRTIDRYQVSENLNPYLLHARPSYFGLEREGETGFAQWRPLRVAAPSRPAAFKGKPVFALTSSFCFSACDTFVSALKVNALGKIYGEATGGGTGSPLVFELPYSGHSFRYSVVRGRTFKGDWIEGQGTEPDVLVRPQVADRINRSDSQLIRVFSDMTSELAAAAKTDQSLQLGLQATEQILAQFGHVAAQSLEIPESVRQEKFLKRISLIDELP